MNTLKVNDEVCVRDNSYAVVLQDGKLVRHYDLRDKRWRVAETGYDYPTGGCAIMPNQPNDTMLVRVDSSNVVAYIRSTFCELAERPYEWQVPDASTPIDAKVWVRSLVRTWVRRHFAAAEHDRLYVWSSSGTSWTANNQTQWYYVVLADPDNPDRQPPADYVPGN